MKSSHSQEPLVSILTPVYNTEKYIRECIESVLQQTYSNWEYVIVNNCSTDGTLEIAEEYAKKDPRIRIHNNDTFLNQMQNWNHGLRQIDHGSKYCKIVHADDWLYPECIEKMVALGEENPNVGIVGSYRLDENKVNLDGLPPDVTVLPGKEVSRLYLLDQLYVFGSPSTLLLRTDVIEQNDPFYDEKNVHADTDVCLRILDSWDFGFVHQVLSYTRRHNESSTAFANRFETRKLGRMKSIKKYGSKYLSEAELEERERQLYNHYHRYLAQRFYELKDRAFWKYHQEELRSVGTSINWIKLFKYIILELAHPRGTYYRFRNALWNKRNVKNEPTMERKFSTIYSQK